MTSTSAIALLDSNNVELKLALNDAPMVRAESIWLPVYFDDSSVCSVTTSGGAAANGFGCGVPV